MAGGGVKGLGRMAPSVELLGLAVGGLHRTDNYRDQDRSLVSYEERLRDHAVAGGVRVRIAERPEPRPAADELRRRDGVVVVECARNVRDGDARGRVRRGLSVVQRPMSPARSDGLLKPDRGSIGSQVCDPSPSHLPTGPHALHEAACWVKGGQIRHWQIYSDVNSAREKAHPSTRRGGRLVQEKGTGWATSEDASGARCRKPHTLAGQRASPLV
jgi:hypothetical protein